MQHRQPAGAPVAPDVLCYSSVVDAYAKSADYAGARRVLREMQDAGLAPGAVAYGAALNAAKRALQSGHALQSGGRADVGAGDPAVTSHEAIVADAVALFEQVPPAHRTAQIYSPVLAILGCVGRREEVVEVFEAAATSVRPWPNAYLFAAAHEHGPGEFTRKLAFRWITDGKAFAPKGSAKGRSNVAVKGGDRPWARCPWYSVPQNLFLEPKKYSIYEFTLYNSSWNP